MKLLSMQKIDKFFGPLICSMLTIVDKLILLLKKKANNENLSTPKKILLLKFWGMGSIILAMPAISKIKQFFPFTEVYFLSLKRNEGLLKLYRNIVDHTIFIDVDRGILKFIYEVLTTLLRIRKEKIDLLIDLEFFTRFSAIITYLSGAKRRAGFTAWEVWRGELHNITVPFNRYWHVKKNFENLISKAINKKIDETENLIPPEVDFTKVNSFLLNQSYICINPNSGELALQRRWPKENFIELTKKILLVYKFKIFFIGSKNERNYVENIVKEINSAEVENLAGKINFQELVFLLKNSKIFITNDSGPFHLAVSLGTPTISFFGPETPVLYGPVGKSENHIVFFKNIDCSPCINVHTGKIVKCYKSHPYCMSAITVDEVFIAVKNLLEKILK